MAERSTMPSLVNVRVTTKLGAAYVFPDVGDGTVKSISEGHSGPSVSCPSLQLTNASIAILSIPWHVVAKVEAYWGEDEVLTLWKVS